MMDSVEQLPQRRQQNFRYLLIFRWASLAPVVVSLWTQPASPGRGMVFALIVALMANLIITLLSEQINHLLLERPPLIALDMLVAGGLVWYTGAEYSPFYLYSMTPILGAAFFFHTRGGLLVATAYLPIYFLAWSPLTRQTGLALNPTLITSQVLSFFVLAFIFGHVSSLLDDVQSAHDALARQHATLTQRNRDLNLLQELTLLLQSSVDPLELQEYILQGLVYEMGYRRAVIGMIGGGDNVVSGWLVQENLPSPAGPQRLGHTESVAWGNDDSPLARALRSRKAVEIQDGRLVITERNLAKRLAAGRHYLILPLILRENALGVIIIDHLPAKEPLTQADRKSLERLAAHAGVALGSVQLCISRAQQQAILLERNRISADLHDSISQVLYGLAFGLDACMKLLPGNPLAVKDQLAKLLPTVNDAQAQMRTAIFDMYSDDITSDMFSARLHRHLHAICPAHSLSLRIELPGEFDRWTSQTRQHIYRIAQEAMTNAAKHADAHLIAITVTARDETIDIRVEDDGQGFDPTQVKETSHLGLLTMHERVERLGGMLLIESTTQSGTVISARIPEHATGIREA